MNPTPFSRTKIGGYHFILSRTFASFMRIIAVTNLKFQCISLQIGCHQYTKTHIRGKCTFTPTPPSALPSILPRRRYLRSPPSSPAAASPGPRDSSNDGGHDPRRRLNPYRICAITRSISVGRAPRRELGARSRCPRRAPLTASCGELREAAAKPLAAPRPPMPATRPARRCRWPRPARPLPEQPRSWPRPAHRELREAAASSVVSVAIWGPDASRALMTVRGFGLGQRRRRRRASLAQLCRHRSALAQLRRRRPPSRSRAAASTTLRGRHPHLRSPPVGTLPLTR